MILTEFPDIGWLKKQIEENFRSRRSIHGLDLEHEGFPSVVINTRITESYRPDIKGPISLFLNLEGSSRCNVNRRTVVIPEGFFFVTNRLQHYTLEIESGKPVETFNIHLGEYFCEGVLSAMLSSADTLLNENHHLESGQLTFSNQLYERNAKLDSLIRTLGNSGHDKLLFEETLVSILFCLIEYHRSSIRIIQHLPAVKQSTRVDLYKRLSVVVDYLNSIEDYDIDLGALASLANLSKYHFLRLFKLAYGLSPYQYVQKLRLEKAARLLKSRALSVKEVASLLGFENSNSFSRLFHQRTGYYPQFYQRIIN
ncbi:MAG TPA: AraC family transcriptional regulator [Cyclobacteriaceae bacterium]|nr:AraC family transcriptional regulator [Cyclobacteriaceae bacterium]